MLILTQDKQRVINFNNIINIHIEDDPGSTGYPIYYETETFNKILGTYSSIERCKEILEEILDFYVDIQQVHSVYTMPEE